MSYAEKEYKKDEELVIRSGSEWYNVQFVRMIAGDAEHGLCEIRMDGNKVYAETKDMYRSSDLKNPNFTFKKEKEV